MLRSAAVQRINQALGFRPSGNPLEGAIISALQEAQRDLERGKTLPKFLLQEGASFTLLAGEYTAPLPSGFIRVSDDTPISTFPPEVQFFPFTSGQPSVYVIQNSVINFLIPAAQDYTLYWDYYKAADPLTSDIENAWLVSDSTTQRLGAPEWLIGEAGLRIAMDLANQNAIGTFTSMRQAGRAACFGEIVATEEASGPFQMGANL